LKLTMPVGAGPQCRSGTDIRQRRHGEPEQRPPPVRRSQFGEERRHGADEGVGDVDERDEQHELYDLVAREPGGRLGLDLIGAGLPLHLVTSGGHRGAGIGHRLADS
jgi:hypothetical protein